jgi:hypothetical protein
MSPRVTKKRNTPIFFGVSVALHIGLLALIVYYSSTVSQTSSTAKRETAKTEISSYLYFPPRSGPLKVAEEEMTETMIKPDSTIVEDTVVQRKLTEQKVIKEIPSPVFNQEDGISTLPKPQNASTIKPPKDLMKSTSRYLRSIDSIRQKELAESGSHAYRRSKTSPVIKKPELTTSTEEREMQIRRIQVDCSNAAKKGVAFVSGLLGGTVKCYEYDMSDFQIYIDKHQNKGVEVKNK